MMFRFLMAACLVGTSIADLRSASQPKNNWKVIQKESVAFVTTVNKGMAYYMEPSAFNYKGLEKQRQNAYDNFLRSNIDNEQDKRNFVNEAGKDHLPFRSYEGAMTSQDSGTTVERKLPPGTAIEATPGVPFNAPLRWNNPHAAELEVNIWILKNQAVVPIMKPTCSGEGHKNQVFEWIIPADFAQLSTKVKGFTGCNKVGDCTLQVYAHSVESRQYSSGVPLIVKATMAPEGANAKAPADLPEPKQDPALDLSNLRDICLPRNDPSANIASAVPQKPRLISDVYNHAYQNSDYSPYSGQHPDLISKNLQAACILKMVTGNRGELGKSLLTKDQREVQKRIEKQGKQVVKRLEGQTNNVINRLLKNQAKSQDTSMTNGQTSANCFRCAEKGATNTRRLGTNTYVPSFQIPANLVGQARNLVQSQYRNHLIDGVGKLQIYTTALKLMQPAMIKAAASGLGYLGPRIKTENMATLADDTQFKKRNAANKKDKGQYATTQAYAKAPTSNIGNVANIPVTASSIKWGVQNVVDPNAPTPAAAPTISTAGLFEKLNGDNKVCRGANSNDNSNSYYNKVSANGVTDCEQKCLAQAGCKAIEFINGGCELWKITPQATKEYTGAICLVRKPQGRKVSDGFDSEAQNLASGNDIDADPEQDSDDQLDPNGWGTDSTCDENQSDEDPLDDQECAMPQPLFTGEDADGNLLYEDYFIIDSAATSLGATWVLVLAAATAVLQLLN